MENRIEHKDLYPKQYTREVYVNSFWDRLYLWETLSKKEKLQHSKLERSKENNKIYSICFVCGAKFRVTKEHLLYCSKTHLLNCKQCHSEFIYNQSTAFCSKDCKKKHQSEEYKKTCLERFGAEYFLSTELAKEKTKKTCLERYGTTSPSSADWVREKRKNTFKKKYGVEWLSSAPSIKKAKKTTFKRKYGVDNISKLEYIKKKKKETTYENYGVYNPYQLHIDNFDDYIQFEEFIKMNYDIGIPKIAKYFNMSESAIIGKIKGLRLHYLFPEIEKYSNPEIEIKYFLDSLSLLEGKDYIPHCRKLIYPKEVDFYLPDYKLAIEVSPAYTHHIERLAPDYHYSKWQACYEKGVSLLTIFDHSNIDLILDNIKKVINKEKIVLNSLIVDSSVYPVNYILEQDSKYKINKLLPVKIYNISTEYPYEDSGWVELIKCSR